jgi:hypothetical protein
MKKRTETRFWSVQADNDTEHVVVSYREYGGRKPLRKVRTHLPDYRIMPPEGHNINIFDLHPHSAKRLKQYSLQKQQSQPP